MSNDHSLFASNMLSAGVREREGWVNARTNDLQRHLTGIKSALMLFVDGHLDYPQLEEEMEKLTSRLQWILDEARSLHEIRQSNTR